MDAQKPKLPLLEQREIEARIVGPLVRAFAAELGRERALAVVGQVIRDLARENGALEIQVLEQTPEQLSFNVTRCRFAEMYRALGLADLGASLSCQRDYALAEGFNAAIHLDRTQTIMEGARHCDFRFQLGAQIEPGGDNGPATDRPE